MFSDKNERLALMIATCIFTFLGLFQLWRAFAQIPVVVGALMVPIWPSLVVGLAALFMAFWLGSIWRHHRSAT